MLKQFTKLRMEAMLTNMSILILQNYFMHGYKFLEAIFTGMKTKKGKYVFDRLGYKHSHKCAI